LEPCRFRPGWMAVPSRSMMKNGRGFT